jgi:UDP-3-O-[3-hydroxymyristoyl] glucosamine N-acyltransferase
VTELATRIAPEAFVDPSATIGEGAQIHPFAYIGEGVQIGARTVVGPGAVVLARSVVACDCVIAPEAVVGSRGFGYVFDGQQHLRIPQVGRVEIGEGSEIGPATCIDRAALDTTSVGRNCQLGALVQIAHNCQVGDDSRIGSGSGLAGSTRIGSGARFGKRVGTAGHSVYGENVTADDLSGMTKTKIPANTHWAGYPARQLNTKP